MPHAEFQSHESGFDYLKSLEIEERINQIQWCKTTGNALFLLSTNDKTVKLWKVYNKTIRRFDEDDGNGRSDPAMDSMDGDDEDNNNNNNKNNSGGYSGGRYVGGGKRASAPCAAVPGSALFSAAAAPAASGSLPFALGSAAGGGMSFGSSRKPPAPLGIPGQPSSFGLAGASAGASASAGFLSGGQGKAPSLSFGQPSSAPAAPALLPPAAAPAPPRAPAGCRMRRRCRRSPR